MFFFSLIISSKSGDPCVECRNIPITITDTWAGQCVPDDLGGTCNCKCGDVFCFNGEIIDRSTCTPAGRLQDCRCISTSTSTPTTVPPTEGQKRLNLVIVIFTIENYFHSQL